MGRQLRRVAHVNATTRTVTFMTVQARIAKNQAASYNPGGFTR